GRFYFNSPSVQPSTPAQSQTSDAAREWSHLDKVNMAELETFVRRHESSPEADYARARIDELKKQQVAVAVPPASPPAKQPQPAAAITPMRCGGIEITVGQSERRCFKPGAGKTESFKDCPTCPEMVVVPAGRFTMGSPDSEPERNIG